MHPPPLFFKQALDVRMKEKGLSFADGTQTIFLNQGEGVKVKVQFDGTEEDAKVQPMEWVCSDILHRPVVHSNIVPNHLPLHSP